jgi:PleD family two-component response regulator
MMTNQINGSSVMDISSAIILLVDDDRQNTAILRKSLAQFHNVHAVHTGEKAIEFCRQTLPDLILLDVMMPNLDGHVTCKILRTLEGMQDCPIIFSTSLRCIEDEKKCWEAGGTDIVSKPVSPLTLLMRIQAHIQLKTQSGELKSLAIFDSLTGLRNRRLFNDYKLNQIPSNSRNDTD